MAFDIVFRDGSVDFNTASPQQECPYPAGDYRIKWFIDRIQLFLGQEQTVALQIKALSEVNSLTDSTSGGAGNIPVPGTLKAVYDIIRPFFFSVNSPSLGGHWLLEDGTKNPLSTFISTSLDYDPTSSQEMLSDGNIHVWQDFFKQATDSGFSAPKDFTINLGYNDFDDTLGVYPTNQFTIREDLTDGFRDILGIVSNNTANDYFADFYTSVETNASPIATAGMDVNGVNANGDYNSFVAFSDLDAVVGWSGTDSLGSAVSGVLLLIPDNERVGVQRSENDGTLLEQDFSFFGTDSVFGERTSRFYHTISATGRHQMFIQDELFEMRYNQGVTDSQRKVRFTDADSYIEREYAGGANHRLGMDDLGSYFDSLATLPARYINEPTEGTLDGNTAYIATVGYVLAKTGDYETGETYTVSNVTPDRTFDPTSTNTNEIAMVLATLIEDLKTTTDILL